MCRKLQCIQHANVSCKRNRLQHLQQKQYCDCVVHIADSFQAHADTHLEAIGIEELGIIGGEGVVEAEGCYRVPGVKSLGEHAEVCQCCEELGNICDRTPDGATNIAVELQWDDAGPTLQACISGDLLNAEQS